MTSVRVTRPIGSVMYARASAVGLGVGILAVISLDSGRVWDTFQAHQWIEADIANEQDHIVGYFKNEQYVRSERNDREEIAVGTSH